MEDTKDNPKIVVCPKCGGEVNPFVLQSIGGKQLFEEYSNALAQNFSN